MKYSCPHVQHEIYLRHSTSTGNHFNIFMSDIDLTIIIKKPFSLIESDQVSNSYIKIKKVFPMLGEIEIFSKSEWDNINLLLKNHGELFQILRDLKKIRWMEWGFQKNKINFYRSYKAKRAIYIILKKYELNPPSIEEIKTSGNYRYVGAGLSQKIINLIPINNIFLDLNLDSSFLVYSKDIDATIGSNSELQADLNLEHKIAYTLLSLFPPHLSENPKEIMENINQLRKNSVLRPYVLSSLKYELLYANASPRIHIQFRDSSWQWTERLIKELESYENTSDFELFRNSLNKHSNELGPI